MPFELLKGVGEDYRYKPMLHGFSKREIQDTIRRMIQLMADLDELVQKKIKERERVKSLRQFSVYCGWDFNMLRQQEHLDHQIWAEMDKVGIEFELPQVEAALETAPDETPPLQHEDYYQRCQNLQSRRGEYWRINPTFRKFYDPKVAKNIGLSTPEKDKYWPTHQVPWEQGRTPPGPYSPREADRQLEIWAAQKAERDAQRQAEREAMLEAQRKAEKKAAKERSMQLYGYWYTPETSPEVVTPPRTQQISYPTDSPIIYDESSPSITLSPDYVPPVIHPYVSPPQSPGFLDDTTFDQAFSPEELKPDEMEILMDDAVQRYEAAQLIDPIQLRSEAFSPEYLDEGTLQMMMDDACQRYDESQLISPKQLQYGAFSPEFVDEQSIQRMLGTPEPPMPPISPDAEAGLRLLALEHTNLQSMSKEQTREQQWRDRMSRWDRQKEEESQQERRRAQSAQQRHEDAAAVFGIRTRALSSPAAVPSRTLAYTPETLPWGQSPLDRISPSPPPEHARRHYPEPSKHGKGKRLVRPKPAKQRSPLLRDSPTTSRSLRPETKRCPTVRPGRTSTSKRVYSTRKGVGSGEYKQRDNDKDWAWLEQHRSEIKRFALPKPATPPPRPPWLLETKRCPTVRQPGRTSTSKRVYSTRKGVGSGEYKQRDDDKDWAWLEQHRSEIKRFALPQPATPLPQRRPAPPKTVPECIPYELSPPREYGPHPEHMSVHVPERVDEPSPPREYGPHLEHMSVYVPETVDESPETFRARLAESISRLDAKLTQVEERLKYKLRRKQQSPWVREEYSSAGVRPSVTQRMREQEMREEKAARSKWDTYMLCKYGSIPTPGRFGMRRMPRTASTGPYRKSYYDRLPSPPVKKTPVRKPLEGPVYGPHLPWVAGSHRPPPKTAAGRIESPCRPAPRPAVREVTKSAPAPGPYLPSRESTPRAQPAQVLYGSARKPPRTAASYKYQSTPKRPRGAGVLPRRLLPSTPPNAAACASPRSAQR